MDRILLRGGKKKQKQRFDEKLRLTVKEKKRKKKTIDASSIGNKDNFTNFLWNEITYGTHLDISLLSTSLVSRECYWLLESLSIPPLLSLNRYSCKWNGNNSKAFPPYDYDDRAKDCLKLAWIFSHCDRDREREREKERERKRNLCQIFTIVKPRSRISVTYIGRVERGSMGKIVGDALSLLRGSLVVLFFN